MYKWGPWSLQHTLGMVYPFFMVNAHTLDHNDTEALRRCLCAHQTFTHTHPPTFTQGVVYVCVFILGSILD